MSTYLRWVDDGRELLDSVHAQVRDCKSTSHELRGLQLTTPSFLCQSYHLLVDHPQTLYRRWIIYQRHTSK